MLICRKYRYFFLLKSMSARSVIFTKSAATFWTNSKIRLGSVCYLYTIYIQKVQKSHGIHIASSVIALLRVHKNVSQYVRNSIFTKKTKLSTNSKVRLESTSYLHICNCIESDKVCMIHTASPGIATSGIIKFYTMRVYSN